MTDVDVIVVGAGLAGLNTARLLRRGGARVLVLEARDRVGGRTYSRAIDGATFDLGGQWLGPTQHRVAALARELGIRTFPTWSRGTKLMEVDGALRRYEGSIPSLSIVNLLLLHRTMRRVDRLTRQVPAAAPERARRAAEWDGMSLETWKRANVPSRQVRDAFDVAVRVVFGAEPGELNLLHFLSYLSAGGGLRSLIEIEHGAQQDRFVGGAQGLALGLAAELGDAVRLSAPVRHLAQDADGVTVHAGIPEQAWRARHVVVAVPPPLAGRLSYAPALPPLRDQLTQRLPMGATTKCIVTYDQPFWRDAGLSGEAISGAGPLTVTFDNTSHDGARAALVGFVVGQSARALAPLPAAERRARVLAAFARFFGKAASAPREYVEQDWQEEQWTRGCPVASFAPGAMLAFLPALRAPVGRLHWAGTETATEWNGYLEGALQSGERAAAEVLARL